MDVRRAADFLRSRPEVDPSRVGVTGISLGAIVGSTTAGVDGRFAKAVLTIGGGDLARILAYSAVLGGALLLVSDVIGRVIVRPGEMPAGVMMAVVGTPLFIALVRRKRIAQL